MNIRNSKEIAEAKAVFEGIITELGAPNIRCMSIRRNGRIFSAYEGEVFSSEIKRKKGQTKSRMPFYELHRRLYRARSSVNCIIHTALPWTLISSNAGVTVPAMLDDMAQIAGVSTKVFKPVLNKSPFGGFSFPIIQAVFKYIEKRRFLRFIRGRDAVYIKDSGALCFGSNADDTRAVCRILEKNSQCFIFASILGGVPLKFVEAAVLKNIYKRSYSRKALRDTK